MKKKSAYFLILFGILIPILSYFFSEKYEGEGSGLNRIYEGEIVFQEGSRVREIKREGMAAIPKVRMDEVQRRVKRIADPQTPGSEKAEILASVDPEFQSLPPAEREKVLGVLTPGEIAGVYLSAAGYRPDQVLGTSLYVNKSAIPYRYVLVGGIVLLFLGALLLVL